MRNSGISDLFKSKLKEKETVELSPKDLHDINNLLNSMVGKYRHLGDSIDSVSSGMHSLKNGTKYDVSDFIHESINDVKNDLMTINNTANGIQKKLLG